VNGWTPTILLCIPLIVTLGFLFAAALFYSLRTRHHRVGHERIFHCRTCRKVYVAERKARVCACPHCGEVNEAVRM